MRSVPADVLNQLALSGPLQSLPDWWEKIDEDPKWQEYAFLSLAAAYGLVGTVALVQLLRIQLRVPEYGWTTQKVFHLLNFLVCALRCGVFAFREHLESMQPAVQSVLLDLPGLLFFSTYTLLVLFWAEIYHQARSLPTASLRPVFVLCNAFAYAVQICLWIFLRLSEGATFHLAKVLSAAFLVVISMAAAVGFLVYGGRLFVMLRRFPIESRGRRKKLREVGFVTAICATCFCIRALIGAWAALDEADADLDVMEHPLLNLIYYTCCEILPSAFVLYILRKLPPKKSPAGYQPIPQR